MPCAGRRTRFRGTIRAASAVEARWPRFSWLSARSAATIAGTRARADRDARGWLPLSPDRHRRVRARDKTAATELNSLAPSATLHTSGSRESDLFELRPSGDRRDDELIARARAARNAGRLSFQFFAPHAKPRSPADRDDEFDTAHLVDLLEAEGWTLENVAEAAECDNPALGVLTVTSVSTIYTFRLTAGGFARPS